MTNLDHARYFRFWLITAFAGLGLVALGNLLIDPLGAFPSMHIGSLDPYRPRADNRLAKAELAHRSDWDIVLLGSSRVLSGFPADYPLFRTNRTVNLALPAAVLPELLVALRTVRENNGRPPRLVILGIDYHMFSGGVDHLMEFMETRFNRKLDRLDYYARRLIGLTTTEDSLTVVKNLIRGKALTEQDRNGFMQHRIGDDFAHRPVFDRNMRAMGVGYRLMPYWPSNRIEVLRQLVRECQEQKIDVRMVIMPVHALDNELLDAAGNGGNFDDFKRTLVRFLADEGLEGNVPLLDATGYAGPVAEEIPPASVRGLAMKYFIENSHATTLLGEAVLNRLFGTGGTNQFGVFLTRTSIEAHLRQYHQDREEYLRTHPADGQWPHQIIESLGGRISPRGATNLPWLKN